MRIDPRPVDAYVGSRGEAPMLVVVYRAGWLHGEVRRSEEHDDQAWCTPDGLRARGTPPRLVAAVERALSNGRGSRRASVTGNS